MKFKYLLNLLSIDSLININEKSGCIDNELSLAGKQSLIKKIYSNYINLSSEEKYKMITTLSEELGYNNNFECI